MADQDLYELLQNADPETLQMMIDAGLVPEQLGVQKQGLGIAQEMANTPQPQGREVGHTYVASSPLEHLAAALRAGYGGYKENQAMEKENALIGNQGAGRLAYLKLLAGQGQNPVPTQPLALSDFTGE